jgi:hypothetical protein
MVLGSVASMIVAAVGGLEVARVWKRGSVPLPQEADDLLVAAEEVAAETAAVARAGYREVPRGENAMFNLFSSFVVSFIAARSISLVLRGRPTAGPFRELTVGRRHIHHFVPGIVLAFVSGAAAIVSDDETIEPWLAIPFGTGMGLTLDESALLLELDDVYWSREGLLSVQFTLAAIALLGAVALALRFLRRGEQILLEGEPPVA